MTWNPPFFPYLKNWLWIRKLTQKMNFLFQLSGFYNPFQQTWKVNFFLSRHNLEFMSSKSKTLLALLTFPSYEILHSALFTFQDIFYRMEQKRWKVVDSKVTFLEESIQPISIQYSVTFSPSCSNCDQKGSQIRIYLGHFAFFKFEFNPTLNLTKPIRFDKLWSRLQYITTSFSPSRHFHPTRRRAI